jgi:hypothetical protein
MAGGCLMFLVAEPGALNHLAELNIGEQLVVRRRGRRQALADMLTAQDFVGRAAMTTVDATVYQGPALDQPVITTLAAGQVFRVLNEVDQDLVWLMVQLPSGLVGYTPYLPDAMRVTSAIAIAGVAPPTARPSGPAPPAPGFGALIWRTITGQSQGLFSCRPDSWFCAGTGAQAYTQGSLPDPGPGGTPPTWFYLGAGALGCVGLLLLLKGR